MVAPDDPGPDDVLAPVLPFRRPGGASTQVDLASVDLDMLATALSDQGGWENHWVFDATTGEMLFFPSDDPEDALDEDGEPGEGRYVVEPLPSWVWYQDMVDFTEQLSDGQAARRLTRALQGRGAFRRFKAELYGSHEELAGTWNSFRDNRSELRAVDWLWEHELVGDDVRDRFRAEHPDPPVP